MRNAPAINWCSSPEQFRDSIADTTSLPVLRPEADATADRWAEIVAEAYTTVQEPAPGVRLVIAWGSATSDSARLLADRSGSRFAPGQQIEDLLELIAQAPERFVIIAALAKQLTVEALATLSAALRRAGRFGGFLTGRGPAELSFAVAKTLLTPRNEQLRLQIFDAASHRDVENRRTLDPDFETQLTEPSLAKALRSHGEGGHAKFPGLVVCGVLTDVEFAEAPGAGCGKHPRRCKRAGPGRPLVLFAEEIRAPVVAFVCCNGFNVAGELYPSPVSMALGFAEGWVGALISPIRPLIAPDSIFATLTNGLHDGARFGPLTRELNEQSAALHQPDAFVLHGDPYGALPATAASAELWSATSVTDRVPSTGPNTEDLISWLTTSLHRSGRGRRVLRSAHAWLGSTAPPELAELSRTFDSLELSMLNALKWAESRPTGDSLQGLQRCCGLARIAQTGWDRSLLELLLASRETFDAFDVGHYDQAWLGMTPGPPCMRCATPTEIHLFGSPEAPDDQRTAESCLVCGPLSESRTHGLRVSIQHVDTATDDPATLVLRAQLRAAEAALVSNVVHMRIRLYDKANGGCVAEELRRVPAADDDLEFRCALPPELGLDLHSARIVAVSGFDVAYARARYARLPLPLSPSP